MAKLFEVTIERSFIIVAETRKDAEDMAPAFEVEAIGDSPDYGISSTEIDDISRLPEEWKNAIPYGGEGDKTCEEYLDELKEEGSEVDKGPQLPFDSEG
jgi:hypothetical protein